MHNVVLSLDGRREIHDALRPTANGKGSFDLIAPRAQELVRRRGDKEHYVRGTFTNRNLDFTNDVRALREMGFEQISLEPVVLPDESPYAIRAEHVETVLAEYDKLASFLLSERKAGRWFNFFHFMVDLAGRPVPEKARFRLRRGRGICGRFAGWGYFPLPPVRGRGGMEDGQRPFRGVQYGDAAGLSFLQHPHKAGMPRLLGKVFLQRRLCGKRLEIQWRYPQAISGYLRI